MARKETSNRTGATYAGTGGRSQAIALKTGLNITKIGYLVGRLYRK